MRSAGYDGYLKEEYEKQYGEIRALNSENRELRRQLGEKVSYGDCQEALSNMEEIVRKWWKDAGGGGSTDYSFTGGCCRFRLYGSMDSFETSPEEAEKEALKKGWHLVSEYAGSSRTRLVDDEPNRQKLADELKKRFPSGEILKIESRYYRSSKTFQISDVECLIRDLDDLKI